MNNSKTYCNFILTIKSKLENFNLYCATHYSLKHVATCFILLKSFIAFSQVDNASLYIVSGTKITGLSEIYENSINVTKKQDSVPIYIVESTVFFSLQDLNIIYVNKNNYSNIIKNINIILINNKISNENNIRKQKQEQYLSNQLPYQLPNCKIKVAMFISTSSLSNSYIFSKIKSSTYSNSCFTVINKYPIEKHPINCFYNSIKSNLLNTILFNKPPPSFVAC